MCVVVNECLIQFCLPMIVLIEEDERGLQNLVDEFDTVCVQNKEVKSHY